MTHQEHFTLPSELLERLMEEGIEFLPRMAEFLLNLAMRIERARFLQADPYERTPARRGYANGYKPKKLKTSLGVLNLKIPQVREGGFYPQALEKGMRSDRALYLAFAEMYVQGVSTRQVTKIVEELCGFSVSSSQVSRAAAQLDEMLQAWRNRPLGETPYLYLDAHYEKVRVGGQVRDLAILTAAGVTPEGKRRILGVSVSLDEQEVHWRQFLKSLKERGLQGVRLIISDDHAGLRAARRAVFGGVPWQRCQMHLQKNARAYVPRKEMQKEVAEDLRRIFQAPDRAGAEALLKRTVEKYAQKAPRLSAWMEQAIPEGLTVFDFPASHRRRLRTNNLLERLHREVERRTKVVSIFPNEASCLRLVSAVLMEIDEAWQVGRRYLDMEQLEEPGGPSP